jgi:hypothetical protein
MTHVKIEKAVYAEKATTKFSKQRRGKDKIGSNFPALLINTTLL